jgi:dihydrofolate synthase/folylpolyglutamate synthase
VDIAVLEVGLGGRLDATTVGEPLIEVVGQIDFDHEAHLGTTLTAIAGEKAAIIRSGVALAARQAPEVEAVLVRRAAEARVPLLLEGRELHVAGRAASLDGQRLDLTGPGWRLDDSRCRLLGVYQPGNALLAAAAAHELNAEDAAIRAGLGAVQWPGRFQVLRRDPIVVLDGAHNPAGARALAASLRAYFPNQPVTFVLGVLADKNAPGILGALEPLAERWIFTASANPRAAAPEFLRGLLPAAGVCAQIASSSREALALAMQPPRTPIVCVAGSLSLIGEVLAQATEKQDILCGTPGR